jgi:hypothetical protein
VERRRFELDHVVGGPRLRLCEEALNLVLRGKERRLTAVMLRWSIAPHVRRETVVMIVDWMMMMMMWRRIMWVMRMIL